MGRIGNQSPTFTNVQNVINTKGEEAIKLYRESGQTLFDWQCDQIKGIMSVNRDGLWEFVKYGISVSRRNGKGEVLAARELYGLIISKEKICHTAHRTSTSHDAFIRLYTLLKKLGYEEHSRKKKEMPERSFFASKQYGLEHIEVSDGGTIDFRTRSSNGGLGEGFDLLIIDEAQEYTSKQESALSYTVSASKNPQTIMVGTPPTAISAGDVFTKLHGSVHEGKALETGWAEWSISQQAKDPANPDLWYKFNPSLGLLLTERNIRAELTDNELDFNIQRLGLWVLYSQQSVITKAEWLALKCDGTPQLENERYWGVKYGHDGLNVALSVASKTKDGKIFVESIDCIPARGGDAWLLEYFRNPHTAGVVADGGGKTLLSEEVAEIKKPKIEVVFPKVSDLVAASALFERAIDNGTITHAGQDNLTAVVSNCDHRAIGGGFGYQSLTPDLDIALMDSAVLAFWKCATAKPKRRQSASY